MQLDATQPTPTRLNCLKRIWSTRWAVLRLAVAAWLLIVMLNDNPSRLARLELSKLPDFDYAAEVRQLREQKRFGEAVMVAEAGLGATEGPAHESLQREYDATISQRDSIWRKVAQFGRGAVIGQGDSIEELVGAITADMLVVGDVRDILIQGSRLAVDHEADPVILTLSAIGLATTVAPEVDWAASILKIAKKAGVLSKELSEAIVKMVRRAVKFGEERELTRFSEEIVSLSKRSSPAGAIRLLRYADEEKDVVKLAEFVKRDKSGAFALHVAGKEGAALVKRGDKLAEETLVLAARKGEPGIAFLRSGPARLLRPHPILGLFKAGYKGTAPKLLARLGEEYLDPRGFIIIALLTVWTAAEGMIIYRRLIT